MNHTVKVMIYNPLSFMWMTSCFLDNAPVGDWREKVFIFLVHMRSPWLTVSLKMRVRAGVLYLTFFLISETCFLLSLLWT